MEELVAEIGAAFLCADLGLTPETREDHAAYIASWLKALKNDKKAVFVAASHAQKAADLLHAYQAEPPPPDPEGLRRGGRPLVGSPYSIKQPPERRGFSMSGTRSGRVFAAARDCIRLTC